MDPLSVISGVVGISAAGATLVSSLYTLVETVRHAPRSMREVAKEMASLTCTLEHLHEIISDGHAIATRRYLQGITSVVSSIKKTQHEILDMIEDQSIIRRLKWTKAKSLLADIQTHKSTVSMQVIILTLGIVKKDASHKMKHSQRRLRKQAEFLVQGCKDSLDSHDERAYRDTRAPAPPPAPVPPDSNLRAPPVFSVSQTRPSTTAGTQNEHVIPPAPYVEEHTSPVPGKEDAFSTPSATPKQEEERKHTITPFSRDSHFDAAALLYDLVFAGGSYMDSGKKSGMQDAKEDRRPDRRGSFDYDLSDHDDGYRVRHQHRVAERRARREQAEDEKSGQTHQEPTQPGRVVDHLLLQWTSLNIEEIKSGEEPTPENADEINEEQLRGKVQAIVRAERAPQHLFYDHEPWDSEDDDPDDSASNYTLRNSSTWSEDSQAGDSRGPYIPSRAQGPGPRIRRVRDPPSPDQRSRYVPPPSAVPRGQAESRPNEYPDPFSPSNRRYPYNPPFSPYDHRGFYGGYGPQTNTYGYPGPYWNSTPYPGQTGPYWSPPPPPPMNPGSQKFDKPTILILRPAYELNEGKDASVPRLDALDHGLSLSRQGGGGDEGMVWNAEDFVGKYGLDGKAVLGALVNDKSAVRGTDMLDTFVKGHKLPMVYVRGSDLGETWFFDAKPVFVLFYHASYKPQFFPAKAIGGDDEASRREYVAIGEEWVRPEALVQLGIVPRERRDGRLILEPSTTHAEMEELVRTSYALLWLQQRRKYGGTFYTTLEAFREIHDAPPPPPLPAVVVPEPTSGSSSASALDGVSQVSGPGLDTTSPPPPPPPPTIHIEEVTTPASTPVPPGDEAPGRLGDEIQPDRDRTPSRSSRERGERRERSERGEGRERTERGEGRERSERGERHEKRHHHHRRHARDQPREQALPGDHLDARSSYESSSVRSGDGDGSRDRRHRHRRPRTEEERREDKEDRRSQGGSDSGFASLFSFAKGGLRN